MRKTIYIAGGRFPLSLRSRAVHTLFTEGECGALAKAIHHLTNCPIIITDEHVAVLMFDGKVLDIEGKHRPAVFEEKWGEAEVTNINSKLLSCYHSIKWRGTLPFAKLLLEKYYNY